MGDAVAMETGRHGRVTNKDVRSVMFVYSREGRMWHQKPAFCFQSREISMKPIMDFANIIIRHFTALEDGEFPDCVRRVQK